MKKGVVQIYYGDGHGKSTAALGSAIHAASDGMSIIVIQFLKSRQESERVFYSRLEPEIKFFRFAKLDPSYDELSSEEKKEEAINLRNGFQYGKKVVATGAGDVVVLDEVLGLLDQGLITGEDIRELVEAKPEDMTLIFTGRKLDDEIRRYADEIYRIAPEKQ